MKKPAELRISINYFDAYPELEAELRKSPPRVRAERLRLLASLGLMSLPTNRPTDAQMSVETRQSNSAITAPENTPAASAKKDMISGTFGQV